MAGVAAVATWPEYRNRGSCGSSWPDPRRKCAPRGGPLSVLAPFKYSFYYDLGWAPTFDVAMLTFEPHKIKAFGDEGYTVRQIQSPDEWETFEALNTRFGEPYNGPVCRDRLYWMRRYFAWDTPERRKAYLVGEERRGVRILRHATDQRCRTNRKNGKCGCSRPYGWIRRAQRAIFAFLRSHRDHDQRVHHVPATRRALGASFRRPDDRV